MTPFSHNLAATKTVAKPCPRLNKNRLVAFSPCHFVPILLVALLLALASPISAQYRPDLPADNGVPSAPLPAEIAPRLNAKLPLDLTFTRHDGATIQLADVFNHGKPVIVSLVYFDCPNVCQVTQESLLEFVQKSPRGIKLGEDYDVLVVSIDPDDTVKAAATKRKNYLAKVPLPESQPGFTYLIGSRANVRTLADAIGFPFTINPPGAPAKIAHPAGIFICTADGHLAQAIGGETFEADQLHFQLRQASAGKIGSGILGAMLSCGAMYFNPNTGRYEHNKWFWVGTGTGLLSLGFMVTFLTYLFKGDAKRKRDLDAVNANATTGQ